MDKKRLMSVFVLTSFLWTNLGYAEPQGGSVVTGNAAIAQNGAVTQITQQSDKAVINWQSFDTHPSEQVQFIQPNSSSIALNRITSGLPTTFQGLLTANGHVWIVNPAGVLFTSTSKVDVGGLLATTMDINNHNFMNGKYEFKSVPGFEHSTVINNGEINTIHNNGLVALVAPGVENNGIIRANVGKVILASGTQFTLDMYGDELIQFAGEPATTASVSNNGLIQASNGQVLLTANAAEHVVNHVVSMNGVIEATNAIQSKNGVIILGGNGGVANVSGKINSNKIIIKGHKTIVDGELNAGDKGFVETSGHYLNIDEMKLNMTNGTWLVDPIDLVVNAPIAAAISAQLNEGSNVTLNTSAPGSDAGNITVSGNITSTGNGDLKLIANNNIIIDQAINIGGNFSAQADRDFTQNANITAGNSIDVLATGNITLNSSLQVANMASFNAIVGDIFYNAPSATALVSLQLLGENVYVNSPINIEGKLTLGINGGSATYINANIIAGAGLEVRDLAEINTALIQAGTIHTYSNHVHLSSDVTMVGGIVFASGVDGGSHLNIVGDLNLNGLTGADAPLAGITVSGKALINTIKIFTSGNQNYLGTVILGANSDANNTIIFQGASVNFGSTVDGGLTEAQVRSLLLAHDFNPENIPFTFDPAINNNLNVQIAGAASFNGVLGNSAPLGSLDVTGPTNINTSSLKTLNTQNYQGPVSFSKNSTLEGSMITFNNTAGPSNPNASEFLINGQSVDPANTGHSYSGSAVVEVGPVVAVSPTVFDVIALTDPVIGQLSTNSLEESQCSTADAACTSAENNDVVSNESEGKIEVLVENPIPKTVAGTVFCMMGFATAIDSSGSERILLPGDKIYMNERVITDESSRVKIQYTTGRTIEVPASQQYMINRVDSSATDKI